MLFSLHIFCSKLYKNDKEFVKIEQKTYKINLNFMLFLFYTMIEVNALIKI